MLLCILTHFCLTHNRLDLGDVGKLSDYTQQQQPFARQAFFLRIEKVCRCARSAVTLPFTSALLWSYQYRCSSLALLDVAGPTHYNRPLCIPHSALLVTQQINARRFWIFKTPSMFLAVSRKIIPS